MITQPLIEAALLLLVCAAAITDLVARRIPNRLLLVGWLCLLPLLLCGPAAGPALAGMLGGAAVGLLVFLPLYLMRGMAAGDVKLMATVGAFVGPADAFMVAIWSWCAGGAMALCIIVCKGRWRAAGANLVSVLRPLLMRLAGMPAQPEPLRHPSVGAMPYGLAIAAGTVALLFSRHG